MSKPKPACYAISAWPDCNAAFRSRGSQPTWLDKELALHAPHESRRGRSPILLDAAIQFCLSKGQLICYQRFDDLENIHPVNELAQRFVETGRDVRQLLSEGRELP